MNKWKEQYSDKKVQGMTHRITQLETVWKNWKGYEFNRSKKTAKSILRSQPRGRRNTSYFYNIQMQQVTAWYEEKIRIQYMLKH